MPKTNRYQQKDLQIENGIVVGNVVNKQQVNNPIARLLVRNFNNTVARLTGSLDIKTILEIGCGEGEIAKILLGSTQAMIHCIDISDLIISHARENVISERVTFEKQSIYDLLDEKKYSAELVVCCEVMEHLHEPQKGLERIAALASPYCLFSVPREPLWRILNMLRGAYLNDLANTPGHVQHWSKRSFEIFISPLFEIIETAIPFPWTFLLCRTKS